MVKRKWPVLSAVLCSSLFIAACSSDEVEEVTAREAMNVIVASATSESLDAISSLTGTLQAYRTVEVAFDLGGVVNSVDVEVGDKVTEGTTLGKLEDADFARQVELTGKSIDQAKVSMEVAEIAAESSAQSVENAKAGIETAAASVESAKAGVAAADAQIASAEAALQAVLDGARAQEREQLKLTVDNAQKAYDTAKTNVERMEKLYAEGLISKQELENVQNGFNSAKNGLAQAKESYSLMEEGATAAQVKQTEAALAAAKSGKAQANTGVKQADGSVTQATNGVTQAQLAVEQAKASQAQAQIVYEQALLNQEAAKATLAKTVLTSPMAGVVLSKTIEKGSFAGSGTPVFTIGDTSKLKAVLPVPDNQIGEWKIGDKVNLSVYGSTKSGTVNKIAPQTNSGSGTVSVEVVVDNADGEWLAGQIVNANRVSSDNNGILVPIEAVLNNGVQSYVFKNVDGVAVKTIVETGAMVNNKIHITKGLKEGEQVVVSGGTLLLDGDPLQIGGGSNK